MPELADAAQALLDADDEMTANADTMADEAVIERFYRAKVALRAALAAAPPTPTLAEIIAAKSAEIEDRGLTFVDPIHTHARCRCSHSLASHSLWDKEDEHLTCNVEQCPCEGWEHAPAVAPGNRMVYVAGPITGDPFGCVRTACAALTELRSEGLVPFLPQLSVLAEMVEHRTYEEWLAYDFDVIRHCAAVVRLPGESPGADQESEFARSLGLPVFELPDGWAALREWAAASPDDEPATDAQYWQARFEQADRERADWKRWCEERDATIAELFESRDGWREIAEHCEAGTITVTDEHLDGWVTSLRGGNNVIFGHAEASGLADEIERLRAAAGSPPPTPAPNAQLYQVVDTPDGLDTARVPVHRTPPTPDDPKTWAERVRFNLTEVLDADEVARLRAKGSLGLQETHLLCDSHEKMRAAGPPPTNGPTRQQTEMVAELRRLLADATPGPWELTVDERSWEDQTGERYAQIDWELSPPGTGMEWVLSGMDDRGEFDQVRADVTLIAAARNALPDLLDGWASHRPDNDPEATQ